jgi:hypothetical protein
MPTFILYKNGEKVESITGAVPAKLTVSPSSSHFVHVDNTDCVRLSLRRLLLRMAPSETWTNAYILNDRRLARAKMGTRGDPRVIRIGPNRWSKDNDAENIHTLTNIPTPLYPAWIVRGGVPV